MNVALFGGSFNPIHNGHLAIAQEVIDKHIADEVWFIPCGNHAFGKELAPAHHRLHMIERAIAGNPRMNILTIELNDSRVSYTADTIRRLQSEFPYTFFIIIGADNLKDLPQWHDWNYLKEQVSWVVVHRLSYSPKNNAGLHVESTLELSNPSSSTLVRSRLYSKQPIVDYVPTSVALYIEQEGLYRG